MHAAVKMYSSLDGMGDDSSDPNGRNGEGTEISVAGTAINELIDSKRGA